MEISNGHQYQAMTSYPLNEVVPILGCHKASISSPYQLHQEINTSPQSKSQSQQALRCPRCDSSNTKFCYYNNYSLSQPRYFCKSCRRYWTKGGSLRNIPVGGGCRKNKKSSSSSKKLTLIQDNPSPSHRFFGILRSGFVGSTNTSIGGHYDGFGGNYNGLILPFDHRGLISVSNSTTATNASASSTISHESCWNGAGSMSWSGFINGFSNGIHDGDI